jgi:hypothetical protein
VPRGFPRKPGRSRGAGQSGAIPDSAILVEMIPQGNFMKVTAMDQQTLTEVSIVGDASKDQDELKRIAAQKLRYVLARDKPKRAR